MRHSHYFQKSLLLLFALGLLAQSRVFAWAPKKAPLMTKWASEVKPDNALPEYPRPQLVRPDWLNLNGLWEYQPGAAGDVAPVGKKLASEILVPFPVESALSGVMEAHERLWYRRSFTVPPKWNGKQVLLHFGAVDYESEVLVNGKSVGVHKGGYLPFSYDVTPFLKGKGPQELIVRVFDPTDNQGQPRGKQTLQPQGIMYTSTTGIWQTVWLEPVAKTSIQNLNIVPDIDTQKVRIKVNTSPTSANGAKVVVRVLDGGRTIATQEGQANTELSIPVPNAKLWSPDSPFLYDVRVELVENKKSVDAVTSYFGMRKISIGDDNGVKKMLLNNKPVFQMGPLDQGFWPDGLYTAPTDEALKYDIEMTKKFGFNMTRKHIKVEPARWYYWTDKLGLMVWQDMPSSNSYNRRNLVKPEVDKAAYKQELQDMVGTLQNVPSIIMWVVFNESQGLHDVPSLVPMVKELDPSRLVNRNSGGGNTPDTGNGAIGDVDDVHAYPPPASPGPSSTQAIVCGEYGGIGFAIAGHQWSDIFNGYTKVYNPLALEQLYGDFTNRLKTFQQEKGLCAAVYTQITDVENELNGLMTYDRIVKVKPESIALANRFQYPQAKFTELIPTSEKEGQTWKYTMTQPSADWNKSDFDDSNWKQGIGGFGTKIPAAPRVGTTWDSPDIWMRRTFTLGNLTPDQVAQLVLKNIHDEDVEIFINGSMAYSAKGFNSAYQYDPIRQLAQASLVLGGTNTLAVHCKQTKGGQYIDVGISQRQ
ncbi:glycoside hydrolase family 2 [bacterium]|nr:MAG: glycoside hydrolase family 2 [bacterium]